LVQKFGINYQNIDTDAAKEFGIPVANLLRPVTFSVAEHVILLILAMARGLIRAHQTTLTRREARDGSRSEGPNRTLYNWGRTPVQLVTGKTLGILGLGEIGLEVAKRAAGLGMKVIYHDLIRVSRDAEKRAEIRYVVSLSDLMAESDFITLHVPYSRATEKIVNYEVLSRMKQGAFLINTSRGGLVDEEALYHVLLAKKISGAALDVYRWEPVPADSPLLGLENVIWSTHNAGGPPEFMLEESRLVLENIARVFKGGEPENWVNKP
jgi:phosphoglycerate dehydrogenase-like enzyme